jgi:hypothetical protein
MMWKNAIKSWKVLTTLLCCVLACAILLPAAKADPWNQMTKLTFGESVEIPGQVLPAGTYWFVLQNASDREIVQIFSEDWSTVEATLLTIPTDRPEPTDETQIQFAEGRYREPEAILKWYYPGPRTGHEFVYSGQREKELARDEKRDVLIAVMPL